MNGATKQFIPCVVIRKTSNQHSLLMNHRASKSSPSSPTSEDDTFLHYAQKRSSAPFAGLLCIQSPRLHDRLHVTDASFPRYLSS
mmetsp:Transcript_50404/g.133932  ORF Transcript_50404/g.133932 Transcript_50404/m.133932 type:complete len:85 (-) Transcript_50404:782-1036(-)